VFSRRLLWDNLSSGFSTHNLIDTTPTALSPPPCPLCDEFPKSLSGVVHISRAQAGRWRK
jgi:hypothetical protein